MPRGWCTGHSTLAFRPFILEGPKWYGLECVFSNKLEKKGKNTKDVWQTIITSGGSVSTLDFLNDKEKNVFRTAIEIDQAWLIDLAGERQKYICQAQSLNLFFPPDVEVRRLNNVHKRAWTKGLKTLYYLRSEAIRRAENISVKVERQVRADSEEECVMCEA